MSVDDDANGRRKVLHVPLPQAAQTPVAPAPVDPDDPRVRAAKRTAELLEHGIDDHSQSDKFYIDPAIIPDGWTYEYRMHTVLGKEDPSYQVVLADKGWEPVPASRHPMLMPKGYTGRTILREGLMLMERPAEITTRARLREQRDARAQVGDKEQQLYGSPAGTFGRDNKGTPLVNVKKSYEPMKIPE